MKLTKAVLRELSAKDKDRLVWDDNISGFRIRIKPNGTKTFVIQYRNQFGRMRRYSIGKLGDLTLDQARREARRLKAEIASAMTLRKNAKLSATAKQWPNWLNAICATTAKGAVRRVRWRPITGC